MGHILVSFGGLGVTFSDFRGYWELAWNLMVLQGFSGGIQAEVIGQVEGNSPLRLGSRLLPRNILAVKYKPVSCKFTNFQKMHL